jgi:hypothetical protein
MGNRYLSSIAAGLLIFQVHQGWSQNVGVGQANPAEMLDVAGRIHLSTNNAGGVPSGGAGTFRWNGSRFEGYNGSQWVSFETPSLLNGRIFVGNASDVATGVVMSGDATVSNTGALTIANSAVTSAKIADGTIVNADVDAAAAIARTKLASGTANRLLVNNGSGVLSELSAGSDGNLIQNVSGVPTWVDAGGVFIRNQTTLQATSNFQISGVGRSNTSFQSPLYTRADAGVVAVRPNADAVSAIQLQNAAGTSILNVDASNSRVGIGNVAPADALEVTGNILLSLGSSRQLSVQQATSGNGFSMTVKGGDGQSGGIASDGGDLFLTAGAGNNISGGRRGGDLVLRSGTNQLTSSGQPNGGDIIFATGSAANAFNTGMTLRESGVLVSHVNIYVDSNANGVILRSPNNSCWRLSVSDAGVVTAVSATCP